ncbi:MAG: hypothetical protein ACI808_001516 [Paraglaciecola sp.]|jgi:hypothetical protein
MKQSENNNVDEMINSRRGLIKKAAAGSALFATVSSRPVWAGQCSLSGTLSGNVSTGTDMCRDFFGYSPGGWKQGHANNQGWWDNAPNSQVAYSKDEAADSVFDNWPSQFIRGNMTLDGSFFSAIESSQEYYKQMTAALLNAATQDAGLWDRATPYPFSAADIIEINLKLTTTDTDKVAEFIDLLIASQG